MWQPSVMQRSRGIHHRSGALAIAAIALCSLVVAGCGDDDDGATTTTTAAAGATTTTAAGSSDQKVRSAMLEDFGTTLEGAGFDASTRDCILGVAERSIAETIVGQPLDDLYQEECGLSSVEVIAGAYYAAFVEKGIDAADAQCARDLLELLSVAELEEFSQDAARGDALLEGCGIDPAVAKGS
jgi:hypothetical protein